MNRLKLDMSQRCLEQYRDRTGLAMNEMLQRRHAGFDLLGRRWHELGVTGTGPADPVLATAKLTGRFLATPAPRHQPSVDFPQQPVAQGKAFA